MYSHNAKALLLEKVYLEGLSISDPGEHGKLVVKEKRKRKGALDRKTANMLHVNFRRKCNIKICKKF